MDQLSLFEKKTCDVVIPQEVISPLETNRRLMSNPFIKERETFTKYIKAIQSHHKCNWNESRKLFFEHRKSQSPITLNKDILSGNVE